MLILLASGILSFIGFAFMVCVCLWLDSASRSRERRLQAVEVQAQEVIDVEIPAVDEEEVSTAVEGLAQLGYGKREATSLVSRITNGSDCPQCAEGIIQAVLKAKVSK